MSLRRPEEVKVLRVALYTEEDGAEIILGAENDLFSLFCVVNYFV